jgi:glycosyltransferase involved in cell wall biosynthesis
MVVHGPYPLGEGRVAREALAAGDAGWQVDVVAMRNPGEPAREIVDGVSVFRLPLSHERGRGAAEVAREYLGFTGLATAKVATLAASRRYDVVHVHNPPDFLLLAALAPRLVGARVVFDIHDLAPELFALRFAGGKGFAALDGALRLVERLATRAATALVTVHEPYRRALEARGVPSDKITVVLNSLDERLLPTASAPAGQNGFRVVYHGTITPHYGVELLVEAAARSARDVTDLRLEIYGDGDALPAVRSRVEALGLSERVQVSGRFLPHREVLELIGSASAGVICNLPIERNKAAVPTKLFEYAALGVPIVAADLPGIREYFSPREVLFFRPASADQLADALREVAAAPETARERAAAARQRYEDYRWSASARRYVALLERLRPAG